MALDFTLLTKEQIWGDDALDVMKKYGTVVAPTDLTILLGGYESSKYRTSEGDLACVAWTKSASISHFGNEWVVVEGVQKWDEEQPHFRMRGVRPVLPPSETDKINSKVVKKKRKWD